MSSDILGSMPLFLLFKAGVFSTHLVSSLAQDISAISGIDLSNKFVSVSQALLWAMKSIAFSTVGNAIVTSLLSFRSKFRIILTKKTSSVGTNRSRSSL